MQNYNDDIYLTQVEYYMQDCFSLAESAIGKTSPNPMVGAIVLDKNGNPVGKGFHQKAGEDHAEVIALKEASAKAKDGTLIVSLEPCCHMGRTPPCTDLIIKSGVGRVVFSNYDPNPLVSGKSEKILIENNIKVISGVLDNLGKELNRFFFKWIKTKKPWVALKQAQSLNAKIGKTDASKFFITDEFARKEVHSLRNEFDAVLVGASTVKIDNPELTVRGIENSRNPIRIILDKDLITSPDSNVYKSDSEVILVTGDKYTDQNLEKYLNKKIKILKLPTNKNNRVNLKELFDKLGEMNILSVLVEGGMKLSTELISNSLIDEYILFIAPKLLNDKDSVQSLSVNQDIEKQEEFKIISHKIIGNDLMLVLRK